MSTVVSISGQMFKVNGRPTYRGRTYEGYKVEGLLMNSRMVQGIFDDENVETRTNWSYPDTGIWNPERNTDEFVKAMTNWRENGLLAFTVNFQGMVVIVGYFYFGQDWRLKDEAAVRKGSRNATEWLLETGHRNILVEIDNECDIRYTHEILKAPKVHELIEEVKSITKGGRGFAISASFSGQKVPTDNVIAASDFILVHGNGPENPERIEEMVKIIRESPEYRNQPIIFNEDDHFNFDRTRNHLMSAVANYASWGYFDPGANNYRDGYQSPPVDWSINTERKKGFFSKLKEITGV